MKSLRFDKTVVHVRDAAIILATSQDPWAVNVLCSVEDYMTLGFYWFNHPSHHIVVTPDLPALTSDTLLEPVVENYRRVILRPDESVPEGWVRLA